MKFPDHNVNVEILLIQRTIRISHGKKQMKNRVREIGLSSIIPTVRSHAQELVAEISYKLRTFKWIPAKYPTGFDTGRNIKLHLEFWVSDNPRSGKIISDETDSGNNQEKRTVMSRLKIKRKMLNVEWRDSRKIQAKTVPTIKLVINQLMKRIV